MTTAITMAPTTSSGRIRLLQYFVVAFSLTWAVLALAVLGARGVIGSVASPTVLITLATLGPMVAAIGLTAVEAGRDGVRRLLARALLWRVAPRWYVAALLGPALVMLAAFLLSLALGSPLPPSPPLAAWLLPSVLILVLFFPALFEEVGWRGYALPRLERLSSPLGASLILGVIHACFHLPIWFIPGTGFDGLPFPAYALLVVGLSILSTWLYNGTGGSLLLVSLLHAAMNAFPLPWGTAIMALPEGARGLNIQIPVALVVVVWAALVVATRPVALMRST